MQSTDGVDYEVKNSISDDEILHVFGEKSRDRIGIEVSSTLGTSDKTEGKSAPSRYSYHAEPNTHHQAQRAVRIVAEAARLIGVVAQEVHRLPPFRDGKRNAIATMETLDRNVQDITRAIMRLRQL